MRLAAVAVGAACALYGTAACAADGTWKTDANGLWGDPGNWIGGVPSVAGDVATFGDVITANRTVTLDSPRTVGGLTFSNTNNDIYSISGTNTLTLAGPDGAFIRALSQGNTQANTVSVPVRLLSPLTITRQAPDMVALAGPVSGDFGIENLGNGTTTLNAANTYSGKTVLHAGRLNVLNSMALGSGGDEADGTLVHAGAELLLGPAAHVDGELITLAGGSINGRGTVSSTLVLARDSVLKGGHFKGNISGDAGLRFELGGSFGGPSTVVLDAANTFTGPVTLAGGKVQVNHAGAFGPQPKYLVALSGDAQFNVPFTLGSLRMEGGRLSGTGPLTLPSAPLEIHGGNVELPLKGPEQIIKKGYKPAHFGALPVTTSLERGTLSIGNWSWGDPNSQGVTVAPRDAILVITAPFDRPIKLADASGYAHAGALMLNGGLVTGDVDLGPVGSVLTTDPLVNGGTIQGVIGGGSLTHAGQENIPLANGNNTYTGATVVGFNNSGAVLTLMDGGRLTATSGVEINSRATLSLNNAGAQTLGDRLADAIPVTLKGGTLALRAGNNSPASETVGPVTALGRGVIELVREGASEELTISSLTRGKGAVVAFKGIDVNATPGGSRLFISTPPALSNGMIGPWAVVEGSDFATYDPVLGVQRLGFAGRPQQINTAGPSGNAVVVGAQEALSGDRTVNSVAILVEGDPPIDLGGHVLNVAFGGIFRTATVGFPSAIQNGTLTAGGDSPGTSGAELYVTTSAPITISAAIADGPAGPLSLVHTGPGTLTLAASNTFSGDVTVNWGGIRLTDRTALPAGADVNLSSGGLALAYSSTEPLDLGTVMMRQGGGISGTTGAAVRPASVVAESGEITARLVGNGPITKLTGQTFTLGGDNSGYSGVIDVNQGVLWVRFHGTAPGSGTVRVHAQGRVLGTQTPTPISTSIELRGGELTPYMGAVNFSGPVAVLEDSTLFTWHGREDFATTSLTLSGSLSIAAGKTLRVIGPSPAIISGPQSHGEGAAIAVEEGASLTMNTDAGVMPPASSPNVGVGPDAAVIFNSTQHLGILIVARGATVTLSASPQHGGKVLRLRTMDVHGTLDLANNALIVEPVGFQEVIMMAQSLDNTRSSTHASTPGVVLAGGTADEVLGTSQGPLTFLGEPVFPKSFLVRFTLLGDANLDGNVNFKDLVRLAQNYGKGGEWPQGDFTADREITFEDLVALARHYDGVLPTAPIAGAPSGFSDEWTRALAQVPEPAALSLLPLAYVATTQRRRRRSRVRKQKGPVALSRGGTLLGQS